MDPWRILIEHGVKRLKMLRNWRRLAAGLKEAATRILGEDVEVCVFGSVPRGEFTAASDLDVLVMSPKIPEDPGKRAELVIALEEAVGIGPLDPNPLEIHLATPKEAEWYLKVLRIECVWV